MAQTVLSLGEWLFKQQQQLQQQLGKLTEKQQLIEEQQQEIEQLKEALYHFFKDVIEIKNVKSKTIR